MTPDKNQRDVTVDLPQEEPVFILRGRDPQAADLVRLWAEGRDFLQGPTDPSPIEARECADAMIQWCLRQGAEPVSALTLLPFESLAAELRRRGATVTAGAHDVDISDGLDS